MAFVCLGKEVVTACACMCGSSAHLIANPELIPVGWYWDGTVTLDPITPLNMRATVPVSFRDGNEDTLGLAVPKKRRSTNGG